MKTIGMLGGMSWESTVPYYRLINQRMQERLGGLHSARLLLYSVDFQEIEQLQHAGEWGRAGELLADAARRLQGAGADFLVICTNTMHKVAPAVEAATALPLLHIADPTARAIVSEGFRRVGLLGTRFTMEEDFYRARLQREHGLDVVVPDAGDRLEVHRIIYDELCQGVVDEGSRGVYRGVIARLVARGAEAVVLGCTEISLLVGRGDSRVPLFDTTALHARAAADFALYD